MSTIVQGEFPYEEIRRPDGNYFASWGLASSAGYSDFQIWSLVENDGTLTYGPPRHYVNVIGFIATREHHDDNTYYEESYDA